MRESLSAINSALQFRDGFSAKAPHARGEATQNIAEALYLSKHIFRIYCTPPQQIACPSRQRRAIYNWRTKGATDGHAMPLVHCLQCTVGR